MRMPGPYPGRRLGRAALVLCLSLAALLVSASAAAVRLGATLTVWLGRPPF
jgi:hypothetical protein